MSEARLDSAAGPNLVVVATENPDQEEEEVRHVAEMTDRYQERRNWAMSENENDAAGHGNDVSASGARERKAREMMDREREAREREAREMRGREKEVHAMEHREMEARDARERSDCMSAADAGSQRHVDSCSNCCNNPCSTCQSPAAMSSTPVEAAAREDPMMKGLVFLHRDKPPHDRLCRENHRENPFLSNLL